MSDISAFVRRTKNADRDDINKLLGLITPIAFGLPEEGGVNERIILDKSARKRSQIVTSGVLDVTQSNNRNRYNSSMRRYIPASVNSFGLTHTTTGTFTPVKTNLSKYSAGCHGSGSAYITVTNNNKLDLSTEITITCFVYLKAASADGFILSKNEAYQLKVQNSNQLAFRVYSGGAWKTAVTYTYTSLIDTWATVIASYKSTSSGQKLYVNGTLEGSDSGTGSIGTNTNNIKIAGDGTSNLPSGNALAYLGLIANEVDSTWRTNFNNGIYDMTVYDERLKIDFLGDERSTPLSESGLFRS